MASAPNGRDRPRVALFMPYGYLPISTSVLNAARSWAAHGARVEVFARTSDSFDLPDMEPEGIGVHGVDVPVTSRLKPVTFARLALKMAGRQPYACAVGFDQGGLFAAVGLATRDRCPCVYHSLEILLREQVHGVRPRLVRALEVPSARRATLVVTQDVPRADLLREDLGLRADQMAIVPNTPFGEFTGARSTYLRDKFDIPPAVRIVLLSGSFVPEHMALDVVEAARDWPSGFVLAAHGWAPDPAYGEAMLRAAAASGGKAHVSFDVLPVDRVDELYSSADVGLAVYRPVDRNFVFIGAAAGKVFGYMRVGTPTIASDLPGLEEFVEATGAGLLVNDVSELPEKLTEIGRRFDAYADASRAAFRRYEYGRHYARVIARLEGRTGVSPNL
jgi:glycosyltransferase involved in cell wall biosynthesis